jgi:hypothetical protein
VAAHRRHNGEAVVAYHQALKWQRDCVWERCSGEMVRSRGGETAWGDKEERLRCLGGDDEERQWWRR